MRPNIPAAILPFLPTAGPTPTSHNALFPPSAGWFPRAIGLTTEAWTFSGTGPSWSAAIVNAVGGYDNNNHQPRDQLRNRANTVVLIIWDDWGGWYDHVLPWRCNNAGVCSGYPGGLDGGASRLRVPCALAGRLRLRQARLHFPSMRPARTTELSKREAAIHPRLRQHPQLHLNMDSDRREFR